MNCSNESLDFFQNKCYNKLSKQEEVENEKGKNKRDTRMERPNSHSNISDKRTVLLSS